jgi:hypothetical protein
MNPDLTSVKIRNLPMANTSLAAAPSGLQWSKMTRCGAALRKCRDRSEGRRFDNEREIISAADVA